MTSVAAKHGGESVDPFRGRVVERAPVRDGPGRQKAECAAAERDADGGQQSQDPITIGRRPELGSMALRSGEDLEHFRGVEDVAPGMPIYECSPGRFLQHANDANAQSPSPLIIAGAFGNRASGARRKRGTGETPVGDRRETVPDPTRRTGRMSSDPGSNATID